MKFSYGMDCAMNAIYGNMTIFHHFANQPEQVLPALCAARKMHFRVFLQVCQGWKLPFCRGIGRSQPKTVLPYTMYSMMFQSIADSSQMLLMR